MCLDLQKSLGSNFFGALYLSKIISTLSSKRHPPQKRVNESRRKQDTVWELEGLRFHNFTGNCRLRINAQAVRGASIANCEESLGG